MAIRIPYGIDLDEVWELDFCAETAATRARIERGVATSMREAAAAEPDAKVKEALEASALRSDARAAQADADLKAYDPGSGPVFSLRAIPGRRRAELLGRHQEISAKPEGSERAVALVEWSRDVVAAAVTGHRNLLTARGTPVAFASADGRPSDRTLEAYGPILLDLAWLIVGQQRLGADGKNG